MLKFDCKNENNKHKNCKYKIIKDEMTMNGQQCPR